MTHTVPQTSRIPTGRRVLRILTGVFAFLFSLTLFTGCGGEKKGQKEYDEGMNFYTVQQYESAVKQFAAAANLGHAEAQNQLGLCFAEGKGVKRDDAEAIKWFKKAAEQGIAESQYMLGCAYYSGRGDLPLDLEEAVKWLKKAAKQDNTDAQNILDSTKNEVIKSFGKAKKGDPDAMFELGVAFYNGDGVIENKSEAGKWLQKAATKGNADAKKMKVILNLFESDYGKALEKEKIATAETQVKLIDYALRSYKLDVGTYPFDLQGLVENIDQSKKWDGPYIKPKLPSDPWGGEYVYVFPGEHGEFDLLTYGADGQEGGEGENADITNWDITDWE